MVPPWFALILLAAIGLVVGSFLGVLVVRLPKGQPVVVARSACPQCRHQLGPIELIPVVSWLIQGARCRACGARIAPFYPLMELTAAAIAVAAGLWTSGAVLALVCLAGWSLLALAAWLLSSA